MRENCYCGHYGHSAYNCPFLGQEGDRVMKTCETCKGTGQVPNPIAIGDIVAIKGWGDCLGVVTNIGSKFADVLALTGGYKGSKGGWYPENLTVQHGHIHIDR